MDDKELFEQLRSGPLPRDGFDESLRRKIVASLDHPRRSAKRPPFLRITAIGASFAVIAAVVVALWGWNDFDRNKAEELSLPTSQASDSGGATEDAFGDPKPHSAVVIGLRKDDAQGLRSSYRTVVVAAENERLKLIGSGDGIWMPYGQNFWKIETVEDSLGKGGQMLVANKVGKSEKELVEDRPPAPERKTEKLLYAGDRYVSILETTNVDIKGETVEESRVVVNALPTLMPSNRVSNPDALEAENVALNEALMSEAENAKIDRWTVTRENFAWVAKKANDDHGLFDTDDIRSWPTVDVRLEGTPVAKDEPLAIDMSEVRKLEPEAVDAFTSQDEDVALILSEDRMTLVPYRLPESERVPLTVELEAGETVVMVHWAIQEQYVKNWRNWFGEWFAASPR